VIQSVSENEGHIEAINTYDNSFLSCGIFQWTAGAGAGAGELPGLLDLVRMRSAATFAAYFGSVGLDVAMNAAPAGALRTGFFVLNGQKLNSATLKAQLRDNLWAYRFWRAAHDPQVRRAQVALAMSRVDAFYKVAIAHRTATVADYISSEYGVALLLDEHVNRPGHVPGILLGAVDAYLARPGKGDPKTWTDADESAVLLAYLAARAKPKPAPPMTNSQGRANSILAHVTQGALSAKRGSFVLAS
jgi:hypothetical protein